MVLSPIQGTSFTMSQRSSGQQSTKAFPSPYNTPPSTESSLCDIQMEFTSDPVAPSENPLPSSPVSARWVASQPVCIQSLLSAVDEQKDFPALNIDDPSAMQWPPSPGQSRARYHQRQKSSRSSDTRSSRPVPYDPLGSDFFARLQGVARKVDAAMANSNSPKVSATKKRSPSSLSRPALRTVDIPNVESSRKGKEVARCRDAGWSAALSPLSVHQPVSVPPPPRALDTLAMDVDSPSTIITKRVQQESSMPPPPLPPPKRTQPPSPVATPSKLATRSSSPKLHPLLVEQQRKKQGRLQEREAAPATSLVPESASTKATESEPLRITASPVRRNGPPVLGMRRAHTAPYQLGPTRPLPTKQQAFKPPFLNKTQPQQDQQPVKVKQEKQTAETKPDLFGMAAKHKVVQSSSTSKPRAKSVPASTKTDSSPTTDDGNSSFGDISLDVDMDALEETLKEYD